MNRFELNNFKNVLIIDDRILISNTFYQSVDDFKYRKTNSRSDQLKKISELVEIEFHSVGHIVLLKFRDKKINLEFYSTERMMEFLGLILNDDFKLVSSEKINLTKSIITVLIPIIVFLLLLYFTVETFKIDGINKYLMVFIGLISGIFVIVKKLLRSNITKYENIGQHPI
ncbi:hypothetical protein ACFSX9_12730 [Flavobacterium ardleyense]|uniref:Uncharacterized protein n=1 Tax=Flavobacterium ardleyense TaxID=2038737 RepID=A0ABW5ZAS7_9FLAO